MQKQTSGKKKLVRPAYNFSNGVRGKFFRVSATQRMIPLDADIVKHFQRRGQKERKAYYLLINEALRRTMQDEKPAASLAKVLRNVIADEVQKAVAAK